MVNLLVVDDEMRIRTLIRKYAEFEGMDVTEAADGMQAIALARSQRFDLVILDVMMPELDGFSTCRALRKESDVPVIMLSARGEEYDRIHGFELGIDDYVVKPFSPKELMMRVQAVLKRAQSASEGATREEARFGGLVVDFTGRLVEADGQRLDLSPKEYDLLFYLVRNRDIALTREQLLREVWGYDFYGDERTLDTHIKLLRRSLGAYSYHIVTLRGVGYRFES